VSPSSHVTPSMVNRKIRETFTLRRATRYGGFNLLSDFVRAQGIDRAFAEAFGRDKAPWATYALPETLRHLLDGYLLGLERVWHFEELEQEPLLCLKRGRERLPDFTLLYRELARIDTPEKLGRLRGVGEQLLRRALARQTWSVLDFDSTVETLYGSQEGARVGPNPHKRGRPSYHPLLCRERASGLIVNSRLRPGDTGTATGAVSFLGQSVARLPWSRRRTILIRADRGFDHEALYVRAERRGWHYVVKLRVTPDLASRIWTHAHEGRWHRIETEEETVLEVAELQFRRGCWSRSRRVILTRRRDPENPQGHLWDALGYNYAAYVTDLDWAPEDIARFYDKRADVEKAIHELKEDFGIDHVPTSQFLPNAADLELKILAFNLLVLYQRQALQWPVLQRAKTLRRRLLALAGQLIRTAGQWVLKLAEGWRWQADLLRARHWLAALGP
jgi:hypothetical protein